MMPAPVMLDRKALVEEQLRATELALYEMADLIDRLLADYAQGNGQQVKMPYTKAAPDEIGGQ